MGYIISCVVIFVAYFVFHSIVHKIFLKDPKIDSYRNRLSQATVAVIAFGVALLTNYILGIFSEPTVSTEVKDSKGVMELRIKTTKRVDVLTAGIPIKGMVKDVMDRNQIADAQMEYQVKGPKVENSLNRYDFIIKNIEPNVLLIYEVKYTPMIGIPPFEGQLKIAGDDIYKLTYGWLYNGNPKSRSQWRDMVSGKTVNWNGLQISDLVIKTDMNPYSEGINLMKSGNLDGAIAYYSQSISQKPSMAAYALRSQCFSIMGRYDLVVQDYTKAIEISTEQDIVLYYNRGNAFNKLGKHLEAIADYNKALLCPPKEHPLCKVYFNRANAYYQLTRYDEAILDYEKSIKQCPSDVDPYLNLANCYAIKGDKDNAIKNYHLFVSLAGTSKQLHIDFANKKIEELSK